MKTDRRNGKLRRISPLAKKRIKEGYSAGLTTYELADELGITPSCVGWNLRQMGVQVRKPAEDFTGRTIKGFKVLRINPESRDYWCECVKCGQAKWVPTHVLRYEKPSLKCNPCIKAERREVALPTIMELYLGGMSFEKIAAELYKRNLVEKPVGGRAVISMLLESKIARKPKKSEKTG